MNTDTIHTLSEIDYCAFKQRLLADQDMEEYVSHLQISKSLIFNAQLNELIISPTAVVNNALFNLSSGNITVEDYAFFGHNVSLLTGTHDTSKTGRERQMAVPESGRDIVVKKGAWIASNATIVGPCVIGENAVVGACSLINKDVPPDSFVAGVPGKIIRKNFVPTDGEGVKVMGDALNINIKKPVTLKNFFVKIPLLRTIHDFKEQKRQIAGAMGSYSSIAERMADDDRTTTSILERLENIAEQIENTRVILQQKAGGPISSTVSSDSVHSTTEAMPEYPVDSLFYHDFEERFRGSQREVRNRMQIYLPILTEHFGSISDKSFIDIGCGRGEWLDVLKEQGVDNRLGIDLNEIQVQICKNKGHDVLLTDCVKYLSEHEDASIDVITGFQIIEHLPLGVLIFLFNECLRVLKPNGMVLFETPNSGNLVTAASNFYTDPTHQRPVHKDLASFLLSRSGFKKIKVIESSPVSEEESLKYPAVSDEPEISNNNLDKLNRLLFGPQDYAVIGVKES